MKIKYKNEFLWPLFHKMPFLKKLGFWVCGCRSKRRFSLKFDFRGKSVIGLCKDCDAPWQG
jgi:hypothetical protein